MNLKRIFWTVTVLAGILFGGAMASLHVVGPKLEAAAGAETSAYFALTVPYQESGASKADGPAGSVDDIIRGAIRYAGHDSQLSLRYLEARSRLDNARAAYRAADLLRTGTAVFYLFFLPTIGAAALSRRARTRDQRAGLAIACLSGIPAIIFAVRYLNRPLRTELLTAPEFYAVLAFLFIGAVIACSIPRRLKAWITSGTKD